MYISYPCPYNFESDIGACTCQEIKNLLIRTEVGASDSFSLLNFFMFSSIVFVVFSVVSRYTVRASNACCDYGEILIMREKPIIQLNNNDVLRLNVFNDQIPDYYSIRSINDYSNNQL